MAMVFKTWVAGDREYFVYGPDERHTKKADFPFPESLLDLMYLDLGPHADLFATAQNQLCDIIKSGGGDDIAALKASLEQIGGLHIYFRHLQLQWSEVADAIPTMSKKQRQAIPYKTIGNAPSFLDLVRGQMGLLFGSVLEASLDAASLQQRLASFLRKSAVEAASALDLFRARSLPTELEAIGDDTVAEVLYPSDYAQIIGFYVAQVVRQGCRFRACKNCGRYFLVAHQSAEYCDRVCDEAGHTCREVGAIKTWQKSRGNDEVHKAYNREYQKRFARIRSGKLSHEDFKAWAVVAKRRRQECYDGKLTLAEFKEWLKESGIKN